MTLYFWSSSLHTDSTANLSEPEMNPRCPFAPRLLILAILTLGLALSGCIEIKTDLYDHCEVGQPCCPKGQEVCEGVCVNLRTNNSHCGSCGHTCPDNISCFRGQCDCDQIAFMTPPDDNEVEEENFEEEEFGFGEDPGSDEDSGSDEDPADQGSEPGVPSDYEQTQIVCDGQCVDPLNDSSNCGQCDNACANGMSCVEGQCRCGDNVCSATQHCENGRCVDCVFDSHCPGNERCWQDQCVVCAIDSHCFGSQLCVDNTCLECVEDSDCPEEQCGEWDPCETAPCPISQRGRSCTRHYCKADNTCESETYRDMTSCTTNCVNPFTGQQGVCCTSCGHRGGCVWPEDSSCTQTICPADPCSEPVGCEGGDHVNRCWSTEC